MNSIFETIGGQSGVDKIQTEFSQIVKSDSRIPILSHNDVGYSGWKRIIEKLARNERVEMPETVEKHKSLNFPPEQYDYLIEDFVSAVKNTINSDEVATYFEEKLYALKKYFV